MYWRSLDSPVQRGISVAVVALIIETERRSSALNPTMWIRAKRWLFYVLI